MGLLGDARFPRRKKADRAGHRHKRRDPEISLWDPSRPAATFCLSPAPRAVQYRLNYWYRRHVRGMGGQGGREGARTPRGLSGVGREKSLSIANMEKLKPKKTYFPPCSRKSNLSKILTKLKNTLSSTAAHTEDLLNLILQTNQ